MSRGGGDEDNAINELLIAPTMTNTCQIKLMLKHIHSVMRRVTRFVSRVSECVFHAPHSHSMIVSSELWVRFQFWRSNDHFNDIQFQSNSKNSDDTYPNNVISYRKTAGVRKKTKNAINLLDAKRRCRDWNGEWVLLWTHRYAKFSEQKLSAAAKLLLGKMARDQCNIT